MIATNTFTPTRTHVVYSGGGGGGGSRKPPSTSTTIPTATVTVAAFTLPDNSPARRLKNYYAQNYASKWVSQFQAAQYEGTGNDGDEYFDVPACTSINFWASLKNIGNSPWVASQTALGNPNNEFTFSIYKDPKVKSAPSWTGFDNCPLGNSCGQSYFHGASWVSKYRIGTLDQAIVRPGELGTVRMSLSVPCNAEKGRYREDISAASGKYWVLNNINGDPLDIMHIWVGFDVK